MDYTDIKEMIFDLSVVLNKLAAAKKDAQRHMQGYDDDDDFLTRCENLEGTLSELSYDIDSSRDDIYKIIDTLDSYIYKMEMDELSQKVTAK
jgi:nicotinamide riboside kinase